MRRRMGYNFVILAVGIVLLVLLRLFGGEGRLEITNFYWKTPYETVPPIDTYITAFCILCYMVFWGINFIFYVVYSSRSRTGYRVSDLRNQIIANIIATAAEYVCFAIAAAGAINEVFLKSYLNEGLIALSDEWKIWIPFALTAVLLLITGYLQTFIFPPETRGRSGFNELREVETI